MGFMCIAVVYLFLFILLPNQRMKPGAGNVGQEREDSMKVRGAISFISGMEKPGCRLLHRHKIIFCECRGQPAKIV